MTNRIIKIALGLLGGISLLTGCQNVQSNTSLMNTPPTGPINFMVPADVMAAYEQSSPAKKEQFCSSKGSTNAEREVRYALTRPVPPKIEGYNSRMDNEASVPDAQRVGLLTLRMSELLTDAKTNADDEKRELALSFLTHWASNDALLGTKTCVMNGKWIRKCEEWTRPDGQDLSVSKDWSTTQMWVMKLAYGYYFALADFKPNDPRHATVQNWFKQFIVRNKVPDKVYYGLDHGWFWPGVLQRLIEGKSARDLAEKLVKNIGEQVLPDGSMKDRTTRGNRALWYHHSAMFETLVSLEIARNLGVAVPANLQDRLEKAGDIFVNGVNDPSSMDKWASVAHNAVYKPGEQQFQFNLGDVPNSHSWWYIFAYRYPDSPVTQRLEAKLASITPQTVKDGMIGFGLGCYYAAASE